MADVLVYGDPILRKTASKITSFDQRLKDFVLEMRDTMYEKDGIGLAAPQIGKSVQLAVIDPSAEGKNFLVLINPVITFFSEETEDYEEGCLSVPDIRCIVNRPKIISVEAYDENGNTFALKHCDQLTARVIQHEIDHLNGILFIDRTSSIRRQLITGKLKKIAKTRLPSEKIS